MAQHSPILKPNRPNAYTFGGSNTLLVRRHDRVAPARRGTVAGSNAGRMWRWKGRRWGVTTTLVNPGTPAGTSTLNVTGTSGTGSSALSHNVMLKLTVS